MILQKIYIGGFGKLRGLRLELDQGLNIIYGGNEAGKSTLATFVSAMLFGMARKRGRASARDRWKRYEPWEGSENYGGIIHFISGGKVFRLQRNFQDLSRPGILVCENDGERLSLEEGDLAVFLGNMTRQGYENTLCMRRLSGETDQTLEDEIENMRALNQGIKVEEALKSLQKKDRELKQEMKYLRGLIEKREEEAKLRRDLLEEEIRELEEVSLEEEKRLRESREKPEKELLEDLANEYKSEKDGKRQGAALVLLLAGCLGGLGAYAIEWMPTLPAFLCLLAGSLLLLSGKKEKNKPKEGWSEEEKRQLWNLDRLLEEIGAKKAEYNKLSKWSAEAERRSYKEAEAEAEAVSLARSIIYEEAKKRGRGRAEAKAAAQEILYSLLGERNRAFGFGPEGGPGINDGFRFAWGDQLSRGVLEQVYFAWRMAAGQLLCSEEELPIILDDAFLSYDRERLGNALLWLARTGKQVIIMTCTGREMEAADQLGISYKGIKMDCL